MPTRTIHRRAAIQAAATTTLGTTALATWLSQPLRALADSVLDPNHKPTPGGDSGELPYLNRIGLQLYTLRDQMKANPQETLAAVAKAGYFQVELMNIDEGAIELASQARDVGLSVHSGFLDFNAITQPKKDGVVPLERILEIAERIGLRHVVFGYIAKDQRDTADKCKAIADRANVAADKTRDAGMRMCYHNHSFEFQPFADQANPASDSGAKSAVKTGDKNPETKPKPKTGFDIFVERFDPQKMEFELDVFWAKIGGHDPQAMMRRLAGRISQLHLKDLKAGTPVITDESKVPKDAFQELGDGVLDMPAIMRLGKEIGVDQCHVEQDQSPAPLKSIVQSYQFLQGKA
ncbi:sugar phosphate isomerase/epimerase family protein [Neorhodopirellula lusitana]|uniref:sugar phosphate isomerase/epimerase family protein n=1 Tax=Neorhodopirellula lusitana TaxID=445327 RepID=UPI00385000A5